MKKTIAIISLLTNIAYAQSRQDTSTYQLIGKVGDFRLLYIAIKSPQDITPRQDSALVHWIETIKALPVTTKDSSKVKK